MAVAEVCDNLSSAHGVLMHANLAIHELVKEEEQRLLAEEQKALTEEAEEHTEKQKSPADEQKVPTEEQKNLTEEHTLPTGDKMEHTKEEKAMVNEQKELIEKQLKEVPNEEKIEHADGSIPLTDEPKSPVDKTPSEEHKVPSEEHKLAIEEQHATTDEQKTHAEEHEAVVKEQREEAEEKREGGVVTLSVREQEMEQATEETGEVDSRESDAVQEVDRPTDQEDNQAKQEVEVTDYHSHLGQRAAVADITVDPKQELVGVQNEIVSLQPLAGDLKEQATVVESDVHEEPETVEQLHPTEGESKQTKPSESDFGKERWSGVGGDAPAGKVAGTDSLSMEENVGGDMAGQSETGDGHGREAVLDHVLAPIGAAVEEEEEASKGIDSYRQEDQTVIILVDSQEVAVEGGRAEAEQLERSEEARAGNTTVEGEDSPPHGEVVERIAEDRGEKDIPTEREEEGPVAFCEGESNNKDDQVKLMAMVAVLPNEVSEVDEVDRRALSPEGGTAMDLSETNTEDSDSSYPDDLIPSQLQLLHS